MIKSLFITPLLAVALVFSGQSTAEAKRVKQSADLTINFTLAAPDAASTASGSAKLKVDQKGAVQTSSFEFETAGLAAGDYVLNAITADGTEVEITPFTLGEVLPVEDPAAVETTEVATTVALPADLNPLSITALNVVDGTGTVVLFGEAALDATRWSFSANVKIFPVAAPVDPNAPVIEDGGTSKGKGKAPKARKVRGHVLVHALIVGGVEKKRKFLFLAQGAPAGAELTINIDGVPVQNATAAANGKLKVKSLPETVRIAGIQEVTVTDATGVTLMRADFNAY